MKVKLRVPVCVGEYVAHGTCTGRAGQPLWLTVPTVDKSKPASQRKIGSEVMSKVQVPPGYQIVGFDLDSCEAVIAGLYADSYYGIPGASPMSYSNFAGDKAKGTDMHSMTAKKVGITRDEAKTANYGLLYGIGMKKLALGLWTADKSRSIEECQRLAKKLIESQKGKKIRGTRMLEGGSDSHAYNFMSALIFQEEPREPLLNKAISTASRPQVVGTDFITSRQNWTIQACGSSMLAAILVLIEHFSKEYGLNGWHGWSCHDYLAYVVPEAEVKGYAEIMGLAHMYTYALLIQNLGMGELPAAIAFPSSIDVGSAWRKTPDYPTTTPSNPEELAPGYSITPAELFS